MVRRRMKKPIAAAVFFGLCITAIVYLVIKPSSSSQREAQRRTKRGGAGLPFNYSRSCVWVQKFLLETKTKRT
jgi:hypothetical protein